MDGCILKASWSMTPYLLVIIKSKSIQVRVRGRQEEVKQMDSFVPVTWWYFHLRLDVDTDKYSGTRCSLWRRHKCFSVKSASRWCFLFLVAEFDFLIPEHLWWIISSDTVLGKVLISGNVWSCQRRPWVEICSHISSSSRAHRAPRPAGTYNPSSVSWVYPEVSSCCQLTCSSSLEMKFSWVDGKAQSWNSLFLTYSFKWNGKK